MDEIEAILEEYERDLEKAREGRCKKISQCKDFRDDLKRQYKEKYKPNLEEVSRRLMARGHEAQIEERSPEEMHYGFSFSVIPRNLLSGPVDRFYPAQLRSSISFVANEQSLSVDIETILNPNVEKMGQTVVEKIPRQVFNEDLLVQKIGEFIKRVFNEAIIRDFGQD